MKSVLLAFAMCIIASTANATISCRAHIALNRLYDVTLDEQNHWMQVTSDLHETFEGNVSAYTYYPRARYYLALGQNKGLLFEIIDGFVESYAICLQETECYSCKLIK